MMKKIILSIALLNLLSACSMFMPKETATEPAVAPAAAEPAVPATSAVNTAQTATAPVAAEAAPAPAPVAEAATLETRSVFFPFDVDTVQAGDRAVIQAAGEYLGKNKDAKARVEGNADERGSSEYNLALGQRRANNVKKLLVLSGAKAAQVETVSYGEEKPRANGHDESAWSQNRRADIIAK